MIIKINNFPGDLSDFTSMATLPCRGRDSTAAPGGKWRGLDPIIPVTDLAMLQPVVDFFGISADFPLLTHTITRGTEARDNPKRLYYVSDGIRHLLMMDETESLKITCTGLKVLTEQYTFAHQSLHLT